MIIHCEIKKKIAIAHIDGSDTERDGDDDGGGGGSDG